MTNAVQSYPSAPSLAAIARFGAAFAASAIVHGILLTAPAPRLPGQGIVPEPDSAPLTLRLAPLPAVTPSIPVSPETGARRVHQQAPNSTGRPESKPASHSAPGARPPATPPAPDLNYYLARELDDYPRPLAPLRLDRPAHLGTSEIRLEILIDEFGVVRDVAVAGLVQPGSVGGGLLAELAATHFMPARKDGRAVRSRIVLSVAFDTTDGAR
jgi:protein TonB